MATATEPTTERDKQYENLRAIGAGAYSSIVEMVAALECDYERLEELRDEREELQTAIDDACADHEGDDKDAKATIGEAERAAVESLKEWDDENGDELKELTEAANCNGEPCKDQDEARERIREDALSVRIFGERTNGEWEADRFEILLTTGGPAVRIVGELMNGEPHSATLETQDWFTPWTEYTEADSDVLAAYCRCFYFGE